MSNTIRYHYTFEININHEAAKIYPVSTLFDGNEAIPTVVINSGFFIEPNECFTEVETKIENELINLKKFNPRIYVESAVEKNSAYFGNESSNEELEDPEEFDEGEICRYIIYDEIELEPIIVIGIHISEYIEESYFHSEAIH